MTQTAGTDAGQQAIEAEATYRARPSLASSEIAWRLTADALVREGVPPRRIAYTQIKRIRLFGSPGFSYSGGEVAPASGVCRIDVRGGRSVALSSTHLLGFGRFEDRSARFQPFVARLVEHAMRANPGLVVLQGMPPAVWALWAVVFAGIVALVVFAAAIAADTAWTIVAALWTGEPERTEWDTYFTGVAAMLMALGFGLGIPAVVRTLRREWPRRIAPPTRNRSLPTAN